MKKICLAVVVVFVLGVLGSVHATDSTDRYRGSTEVEFRSYQKKNLQLSPRRRAFSRRLPESMRSGMNTSLKTWVTRRSRTGLRLNNAKLPVRSTRKISRDVVSVPSVQFWAKFPEGFIAQPTDITWTDGVARFERGDEWIELIATGDRCDGGSSFAQTCLRFFSNKMTDELRTEFPYARTLKNERTSRDRGHAAGFFQKTNTGWWFLLEDGNDREGVLTFFDPTNEYLWHLRIHSSGEAGKFLADSRNWTQVFESLFEDPTVLKSSPRNTIEYVRRRR